jgi:hypothetical protein
LLGSRVLKTQLLDYNNGNGVFSAVRVELLKQDNGELKVAGYSPDSNDVSTEVEKSSFLEAVTRKHLKTLQRNSHC